MKGLFQLFSISAAILLVVGQTDLTLLQVNIITRHGARTPYGEIPNYPVVWNCTLTGLEIPDNTTANSINLHRIYRKNYIPGAQVLPGNCFQGELTSAGFMNHYKLGQKLRSYYIDELGFLSSQYNPEEVYVRSTDVPRTFKSAEANMLGLYPPQTRGGAHVINIYTVESTNEILVPSFCPNLINWCNQIQNTTAWQEKLDSMEALKQQLLQEWNATESEFPWWIGLFGILESRLGNDLPFPPGVDMDTYNEIMAFAVWEIQTLFANQQVHSLGIGKFIGEIYGNLVNGAAGIENPKWFFYSGHDVTIAYLLSAFDVFDGTEWPSYASNIIFELYQDDSEEHYVQMKYNGDAVLIPGCPTEMCPFNTFEKIAVQLIPMNWEQECGISSKRYQRYLFVREDSEAGEVTEFFC